MKEKLCKSLHLFSENIILGCDNLTQSTLKLIGKGNIVELGISGIDDTNLETAIE